MLTPCTLHTFRSKARRSQGQRPICALLSCCVVLVFMFVYARGASVHRYTIRHSAVARRVRFIAVLLPVLELLYCVTQSQKSDTAAQIATGFGRAQIDRVFPFACGRLGGATNIPRVSVAGRCPDCGSDGAASDWCAYWSPATRAATECPLICGDKKEKGIIYLTIFRTFNLQMLAQFFASLLMQKLTVWLTKQLVKTTTNFARYQSPYLVEHPRICILFMGTQMAAEWGQLTRRHLSGLY